MYNHMRAHCVCSRVKNSAIKKEWSDQQAHPVPNLYSAVVRVQEKLSQWGDLRSTVPAIGAVDEDGASIFHSRHHHVCPIQDGPQMLQPLGGLQVAHPAEHR